MVAPEEEDRASSLDSQLTVTERENERLRLQLAQAKTAMLAAQMALDGLATTPSSPTILASRLADADLDARLREASAVNEVLKERLADLPAAPADALAVAPEAAQAATTQAAPAAVQAAAPNGASANDVLKQRLAAVQPAPAPAAAAPGAAAPSPSGAASNDVLLRLLAAVQPAPPPAAVAAVQAAAQAAATAVAAPLTPSGAADNEVLKQRQFAAQAAAPAAADVASCDAANEAGKVEEAGKPKWVTVQMSVAAEAKERGNVALLAGKLADAIEMYNRGLKALQPLVEKANAADAFEAGFDAALLQGVMDLEVSLQLNLAQACIKQEDYWGALEAAGTVLERRPGNAKGLFRRGVALARLGEKESAAADFKEVLDQGPNADASRELCLLDASGAAGTARSKGAANGARDKNASCRSAFKKGTEQRASSAKAPKNDVDEEDRTSPPSDRVDDMAAGDDAGAASVPAAVDSDNGESQLHPREENATSEETILDAVKGCIDMARGMKEAGNLSLMAGDYERAQNQYRRGLSMLVVYPVDEVARGLNLTFNLDSKEAEHPAVQVLGEASNMEMKLQLNLSLACLKCKDYESAIAAAAAVIDCRADDSKAHYRRGIAYLRMGKNKEAASDFEALAATDQRMARACLAEFDDVASPEVRRRLNSGQGTGVGQSKTTATPPSTKATPPSTSATMPPSDVVVNVSKEDEDEDEETAFEAVRGGSQARGENPRIIIERAQAIKAHGNEQFGKHDYGAAAESYRLGASWAASAATGTGTSSSSDAQNLKKEAEGLEVALNINLAQCHLKLNDADAARDACDEALRVDPKNVKGRFRRAKAHLLRAEQWAFAPDGSAATHGVSRQKLLDLAAIDLGIVLAAEPKNEEAQRELSALRALSAPRKKTAGDGLVKNAEEAADGGENPFAGIFADPKMLKARNQSARDRRRKDEAENLRQAGNTAHRAADYKTALQRYTEALAIEPNSATLLLNRAATQLMLESFASGFEDCKLATQLQPELAKAYLRGAKCLQMQNDFGGADAFLSEGMERIPAEERRELSEQRVFMQKLQHKISEINKALTVDLVGETQGRWALRLVLELEQLQPPSRMTRSLRLRALLQARDSARAGEAERLSSELVINCLNPDPEVWFCRAWALLLVGQRSNARTALKKAMDAGGVEPPPAVCEHAAGLDERLDRADVLKKEGNKLFTARRWEEASERYEDACREAAGDMELLGILHTNIAASLRRVEQRTADAYRHAVKAVEASPKYAKAHFRRGVLHYDEGRWDLSLKDFRRAAELEPNLQGLDVWLRRGQHATREGKDRKNHYKVLGLFCECDAEEVKKRYRQLARECHPDKLISATESEKNAAEVRFRAVNEAQEILGTPESRKEYDYGNEDEARRGLTRGHAHHQGGFGSHPFGRRGGMGGFPPRMFGEDDDDGGFHF